MTSEEVLLSLLKGSIHGLRMNLDVIKMIPDTGDNRMAGFDDGKVVGISYAIGSLEATLRLYDRFLKGEMPGEMVERLKEEEKTDPTITKEVVDQIVQHLLDRKYSEHGKLPGKQ